MAATNAKSKQYRQNREAVLDFFLFNQHGSYVQAANAIGLDATTVARHYKQLVADRCL